MRILTTIAIGFVLLGQLGCTNDNFNIIDFNDDSSLTLNGTWKVLSFEDYSTGTAEYKTQENSWGRDIIVTFNDSLNPKLFSARVTTNSGVGKFEYVGQRLFSIFNYETTLAGQPMWASKFIAIVLDGEVSFKVSNKKLRIYNSNKSKSVTLTRE